MKLLVLFAILMCILTSCSSTKTASAVPQNFFSDKLAQISRPISEIAVLQKQRCSIDEEKRDAASRTLWKLQQKHLDSTWQFVEKSISANSQPASGIKWAIIAFGEGKRIEEIELQTILKRYIEYKVTEPFLLVPFHYGVIRAPEAEGLVKKWKNGPIGWRILPEKTVVPPKWLSAYFLVLIDTKTMTVVHICKDYVEEDPTAASTLNGHIDRCLPNLFSPREE